MRKKMLTMNSMTMMPKRTLLALLMFLSCLGAAAPEKTRTSDALDIIAPQGAAAKNHESVSTRRFGASNTTSISTTSDELSGLVVEPSKRLTTSRKSSLPQACFLDDSLSASPWSKCWTVLTTLDKINAGSLCLTTIVSDDNDAKADGKDRNDAFDITFDANNTGWYLDELYAWIGQPGTYPRMRSGVPNTSQFAVQSGPFGKRHADKPRPSMYTVPLAMASSWPYDNDDESATLCRGKDQSPSFYQLLAQVKVYNSHGGDVGMTASVWDFENVDYNMEVGASWAITADVTLGCDCPDTPRTARRTSRRRGQRQERVAMNQASLPQEAMLSEIGKDLDVAGLFGQNMRRMQSDGTCMCACTCSAEPSQGSSLFSNMSGEPSSWSPSRSPLGAPTSSSVPSSNRATSLSTASYVPSSLQLSDPSLSTASYVPSSLQLSEPTSLPSSGLVLSPSTTSPAAGAVSQSPSMALASSSTLPTFPPFGETTEQQVVLQPTSPPSTKQNDNDDTTKPSPSLTPSVPFIVTHFGSGVPSLTPAMSPALEPSSVEITDGPTKTPSPSDSSSMAPFGGSSAPSNEPSLSRPSRSPLSDNKSSAAPSELRPSTTSPSSAFSLTDQLTLSPSSELRLEPSRSPLVLLGATNEPTMTLATSNVPTTLSPEKPASSPLLKPSAMPVLTSSEFPTSDASARPSSPTTVSPSSLSSFESSIPYDESNMPSRGATSSPMMLRPSQAPFAIQSAGPNGEMSVAPSSMNSKLPVVSPSSTSPLPPVLEPSQFPFVKDSAGPSENPTVDMSSPMSILPTVSLSTSSALPSALKSSLFPTTKQTDVPSRSTFFKTSPPSALVLDGEGPNPSPSSELTLSSAPKPSESPSREKSAVPSKPVPTPPSAAFLITPSLPPSHGPTLSPSLEPSRPPSAISDSPTFLERPSLSPLSGSEPSQRPSSDESAGPSTGQTKSPSNATPDDQASSPSIGPTLSSVPKSSQSPFFEESAGQSIQPTVSPPKVSTGGQPSLPSTKPNLSPSHVTDMSFMPSAPSLLSGPNLSPVPTGTQDPSDRPTMSPSTVSSNPTSDELTITPSGQPDTSPVLEPHRSPSSKPSSRPSSQPSELSTSAAPSKEQVSLPPSQEEDSIKPVLGPSRSPTNSPTLNPTSRATAPSALPSIQSTLVPSEGPMPSLILGESPSPFDLSSAPSSDRPIASSSIPSFSSQDQPTSLSGLSSQPSRSSTGVPSRPFSTRPSTASSGAPDSAQPSQSLTNEPSRGVSGRPNLLSANFSAVPSDNQSQNGGIQVPSSKPTGLSDIRPASSPSKRPTEAPSVKMADYPTQNPNAVAFTRKPTSSTTSQPTDQPTAMLAEEPTFLTNVPTNSRPASDPKTPICGPSIRRAWHDTSCEDRSAYLRAVELLYKLPANNSLSIPSYLDWVNLHASANNSAYAHGANDGPFLPWHRWYLWKFEKALQTVSGSCVTLPYWDWSKDKGREMHSSVLSADSFGSSSGIDKADGCVNEGIASKNGFWKTTVRTGGCLKRAFNTRYASFSAEEDLVRLIMNYPAFGSGLSGFSNNLQGAPHAVVHNFISQHMSSMHSPDDPLFMLHHCNIDRIWALYQDYHGQNHLTKDALSDKDYSSGRGIGLDDPLPFSAGTRYSAFFKNAEGRWPTPRDMHYCSGDDMQVTYANDFLGFLLSTINPSYTSSNIPSWIELATGPVSEIVCSRRLQQTTNSGSISASEASDLLGISKEVPPWSNITTRLIWDNLTASGLSPKDVLNTLAYRGCQEQGNQLLASPSWIAMQGMQKEKGIFKCFNRGNPLKCIPRIKVASKVRSFAFKYDPVEVVSFGDAVVSFSLSQVWMPGSLDMVAVHYTDADGSERCDTLNDVLPGELGIYEAQCMGGVANVKLYAHDPAIMSSASANSVTEVCGGVGVPLMNTYVHSITIPCQLAGKQCPPPSASDPICDGTPNFEIANDIFDTPKDVSTWIFSDIGRSRDLGKYLEPKGGTSKTFRVPRAASNLTTTLEIYELDCSAPMNVTLLVSNNVVELGTLDCFSHAPTSFVSKNVSVNIISEAATADKVVLVIPSEYYRDSGRLTIGIRNEGIGIGSLTMTADCSGSLPIWKQPEVVSIIEQVVVP